MTTPTRTTRRYALGLWLLLGAFAFRVAAQPVQLWRTVPWLPPFEAWHSGALPYAVLVTLQALILAAQARLALAFWRGRVVASHATGRRWLGLGAIYFGLMLTRLALGASLLATQRWFSAWLPTVFHLVLASFVLVVGAYHWRHAPRSSPSSDDPAAAAHSRARTRRPTGNDSSSRRPVSARSSGTASCSRV
jgi:hypothetical protein